MLTTSRYPSPSTRHCAQQLAHLFGCYYIPRSKKTIEQLATMARKKGNERILIVEESQQKNKLAILAIDEIGQWKWIGEMGINNER